VACASPPTALPADSAQNTKSPAALVQAHLRAVEAGDWPTAESQLAPEFTMQMKGMPFFVKIRFADALAMHKARKQAFPDFTFNEKIDPVAGNSVRVAVFLKGTHTGYLDYPIFRLSTSRTSSKTIASRASMARSRKAMAPPRSSSSLACSKRAIDATA
jgi:hypothetical protein